MAAQREGMWIEEGGIDGMSDEGDARHDPHDAVPRRNSSRTVKPVGPIVEVLETSDRS